MSTLLVRYDAMNPEQKQALDAVSKGQNIFITGGAGVGKSYLVNEIVKSSKKTEK
jgi:Flp pilus assembly CpaF family ATPase